MLKKCFLRKEEARLLMYKWTKRLDSLDYIT